MPSASLAHGSDTVAQEEAEGKIIWEKFQAKTLGCADLSDEDFAALGEYFMGVMLGTSHEAMNNMMIQMMGESGEEKMHVAMGKRMSGCDSNAAFPPQGIGFMPMMQMVGGPGAWGGVNWSSPHGLNSINNSMMSNFGFLNFGWLGFIFMTFWWALIIAVIVAIVKWLVKRPSKGSKSAIEILKERYAKSEIGQQEFENKKRELL